MNDIQFLNASQKINQISAPNNAQGADMALYKLELAQP